jgi:CDP-glycerol glycerophosphotransferase
MKRYKEVEFSNIQSRFLAKIRNSATSTAGGVESRIGARVVNSLSRRNRHESAIAIAQSKPFMQIFGRFALANSYYRAEDYSAACQEFRRVIHDNPESKLVLERLATSAMRSGETRLQELTAQTLVEIGRPAGDELTKIAQRLDAELGYEAAETYYWHAFSQWGNPLAHDAIVRGLRKARVNQWRVLEVMESGENLHQNSVSWEVEFASELAKAGRYYEAASRYPKIRGSLTADQQYAFGYYYQRAGDTRSSAVAYSRAVDRDEKRNASRFGIGVFHEHHKRWALAAEAYVVAAESTSNDETRTELFFRAGYCFEAALDLPAARVNYDRAVEHNPRSKNFWVRSGVAAELSNDASEAIERYKIGLALAGSADPELHFRIGFVEFGRGNIIAALEHFFLFVGAEAGPNAFESDSYVVEPNAGEETRLSEPAGLTAPNSRLGSKGHIAWGDIYFERGDWEAAVRHYDLGFLSGGLPKVKLRRQMESLVKLNRDHEACQRAVEWRKNPEASPLKLETPRRGGYEDRNISYEQYRRNLQVRSDIILFESNLGLGVDCHPLEISRHILKDSPGKFIHAWVVGGDVPLPADLECQSDVIVVRKGSAQELRLFAIAGYIVNNSTFPTHPVLRSEQRYMNTWHGTPLKAMMKDTPEPLDYANISRNFLQATALIYPSGYAKNKILGRTGLGDTVRAQVEMVGSPRSDALLERQLDTSVTIAPNEKVLVAPTWRPESDIESEIEKLVSLVQSLHDAGHEVLVRAHHYVEAEIVRRGLPLNIVPRTIPTNDLLCTVDVLVTDFSSICFDFAITRRPIVFYVPDWDRYRESRGLYLEQGELPGTVCKTISAVVNAVSDSTVSANIDTFLGRFAPHEDGLATERAVQLLFHGPTTQDLRAKESNDGSVLLRGEFLANGISAALVSMANALSDRGVRVGVLTGAEAVKKDPVRQAQLDRLADKIPIVARVGAMVNSSLQYHARRVVQRAQGAPVTEMASQLVADAYATEHRRVLGTSFWTASVEYEGYSEFWADLVLAAKNSGSSTSIFMHNDIVAEIKMKFPWMERIARRYTQFDNAISVSHDLAKINQHKLSSLRAVGDLTVKGARNIIDPSRILCLSELPLDSDIERWLEGGCNLILSIGRLSPEKNHEFLIDVMSKLCVGRDDVRLIICGEGPLRNKLEAQIRSCGLERFVMLAGHRDSVYSLMHRSDLFVLPSLHEGQPIVLLEAVALGSPCLTSDIAPIEPFRELGVNMCELDRDRWVELIGGHLDGTNKLINPSTNMAEYIEESITEFSTAVAGGGLKSE